MGDYCSTIQQDHTPPSGPHLCEVTPVEAISGVERKQKQACFGKSQNMVE